MAKRDKKKTRRRRKFSHLKKRGRKHISKKEPSDFLEGISSLSYFDLEKSERLQAKKMIVDGLITSFTYTLNPLALKGIAPGLKQYIVFVDTRRNDCYHDLRKYLNENKTKYTSFFTIGDADFLIIFSSDQKGFDMLYQKLLQIHKFAPLGKGESTETLFQAYEIKEYNVLSRVRVSLDEPDVRGIVDNIDLLSKVELTLQNYLSKQVMAEFKTHEKIKIFLKDLKERSLLLNYHIIRNFIPFKIRTYILVLYAQPGYQGHVISDRQIAANIVDFVGVSPVRISDEFYNSVNSIIVAEFDSIQQYHAWKERLYGILLSRSQNINVMTFMVEGIISELPPSLGNYVSFRDLCDTYNSIPEKEKIYLGKSVYKSEEEQYKIGLDARRLNRHGLIIGAMGCGKTSTAITLAKRFVEAGKRVHLLDCTEGFVSKLREVFPDGEEKGLVKYAPITEVISSGTVSLEKMSVAINIYKPEEKDFLKLALIILQSIPKRETAERETKDVIMIEEAHSLFSNKDFVDQIFSKVRTAGREGVSIWLSTHKLSDLPTRESGEKRQFLHYDLQNRIIHQINEDVDETIDLITENINEAELLYDFRQDLRNLKVGHVIISSPLAANGNTRQLPPLRIHIDRKG